MMMKLTTCFGVLSLSLGLAGCGQSASRMAPPPTDSPDLTQNFNFGNDDAGPIDNADLVDTSGPDVCGDPNMSADCQDPAFGPPNGPFPLQSDMNKDPLEKDNGVNRDKNGWLGLDSTHSAFNY